jgi:hypothetical protein
MDGVLTLSHHAWDETQRHRGNEKQEEAR